MFKRPTHSLLPLALAGAMASSLGACNPASPAIAGNCTEGSKCSVQSSKLVSVDKLDILLVVDNSGSVSDDLELFKSELPRMLTAFVDGDDPNTGKFPPVQSVNLAVLTSDMGLAGIQSVPDQSRFYNLEICDEHGGDGLFQLYSESDIQHCDPTRPSFLSFRGDAAIISAVDSVSCLPSLGDDGCGFEQPLEAILKSLAPDDGDYAFASGEGHGNGPHTGFLRDDSLLVVIVVTDEDDCSIADTHAFLSQSEGSLNLFCSDGSDHLHPVTRYSEALKSLRPTEDDIIFAVVAGIPPALIAQQSQELGSQDAFFRTVLNDPALELLADESGHRLETSCANADSTRAAQPPRRLVEVAQSFGDNGVVGSICDDDFGSSVGNIMRTVAERLRTAAPTESAE